MPSQLFMLIDIIYNVNWDLNKLSLVLICCLAYCFFLREDALVDKMTISETPMTTDTFESVSVTLQCPKTRCNVLVYM